MMQRQFVSSGRIRSVGWSDNTLEVEFKDGVSESEYQAFIRSGSLGSALSRLDKIHPYNSV